MQTPPLHRTQQKTISHLSTALPVGVETVYAVSKIPLAHRPNFCSRSISPRLIGRLPHSCGLLPRFSGISIGRLVGGESGRLAGADVGILPTGFVDLLTLFRADGIVMLLTLCRSHLSTLSGDVVEVFPCLVEGVILAS